MAARKRLELAERDQAIQGMGDGVFWERNSKAGWLVRAFLAMNATPLPRREAIGMDGSVLAFTLGLALLTPLLFGILPALRSQ